MKSAVNLVIGLAALLSAAGCDSDSNAGKSVAGAPGTGASPAASAVGGSSVPEGSVRKVPKTPASLSPAEFTGTVVETMDSGGYTYIEVDTGQDRIWAAANKFEVKVGEVVVVPAGMPMTNFHSSTLNRDFERIYFTGDVRKVGAAAAPALSLGGLPGGHPPLPGGSPPAPSLPGGHPELTGAGGASGPSTNPHSRAQAGAGVKIEPGSIETPSGGLTVAAVFEGRKDLVGKPVIVRGKVVKFTGGILGRNWLHVMDGTGAAGTDDLTVTSTDKAAVGDTVVVRGTVAVDKDFGFGYKYATLIENASVTVE